MRPKSTTILAAVFVGVFAGSAWAVDNPAGIATVPPSSLGGGLVTSPNPLATGGNLVLTGNVAWGRHFRGIVPYQATSYFAAPLGSSGLDSFLRRSGEPDDLGVYGRVYEPYYSRTQTVASTGPEGQISVGQYLRSGSSGARLDASNGSMQTGLLQDLSIRQDGRSYSRLGQTPILSTPSRRPDIPDSINPYTRRVGEENFAREAETAGVGRITGIGEIPAQDASRGLAIPPEGPGLSDGQAQLDGGYRGLAGQTREGFVGSQRERTAGTLTTGQQKLDRRDLASEQSKGERTDGQTQPLAASRQWPKRGLLELPMPVEKTQESGLGGDKSGEAVGGPAAAISGILNRGGVEELGGVRKPGAGSDYYSTLARGYGGEGQTVGGQPLQEPAQRSRADAARAVLDSYPSFEAFISDKYGEQMKLAEKHLAEGKYYSAADYYTLAMAYKRDDAAANAGKSCALLAAGEYMSSALFLARSLEALGGHGDGTAGEKLPEIKIDKFAAVLVRSAFSLIDRDRLEKRVVDIGLWQKQSDSPELEFLLSWIYYHLGRTEQAQAAIKAARQKMPDVAAVAVLERLIDAGRAEKADEPAGGKSNIKNQTSN